jgi:hypothetical protein
MVGLYLHSPVCLNDIVLNYYLYLLNKNFSMGFMGIFLSA